MQKQTCDNGSKQRKKKCMQDKIRTSKWVKQLKVFKCRKRERIERKERKRKNSFLLFISNMEATKQLTAIKRVDNSPTLTNPLSFPSLPSLQPSQQPESQTSSRTSTSNSRTPKILLWAICALIKCPAASASLLNLVAFVRFDVGCAHALTFRGRECWRARTAPSLLRWRALLLLLVWLWKSKWVLL